MHVCYMIYNSVQCLSESVYSFAFSFGAFARMALA